MDENEAFKWWNSLFTNASDVNLRPSLIESKKAFFVWTKICPYFQSIKVDYDNSQVYWETMQKAVGQFVPNDEVPNPITNFSDFIKTLYSLRNILYPKNASSCLKLVNVYKAQKPGAFCLYKLPLYFLDPINYFKTLTTLQYMNHPLWKNAISNAKVVDTFFEMHSNFITLLPASASSSFWEQRIYIIETLFQLNDHIVAGNSQANVLKNHPKGFQYSAKLLECCIKLINTAPFSVKVVLFRYIIRILKISNNKFQPDVMKILSTKFILKLDKTDSQLTLLAVKFIFSFRPFIIQPARIIKMISSRGIKSTSDIEILSFLCEGTSTLSIIIFLCRSALTYKLWHRACISEVAMLIQKYSNKNDVRDWLSLFIRRLFIFIGIASSKFKYKTRTLLLIETLSSLQKTKITWLQQAIQAGASSINSTRSVPPYFKNFFPISGQVDDITVHEFESFSKYENLKLKVFPFDSKKGTLTLPPLVDIHNQHLPSSQKSFGIRVNSRNDRASSCRNEIRSAHQAAVLQAQKKRPEPLIKKPSGTKSTRPLASAICVTPIHRR